MSAGVGAAGGYNLAGWGTWLNTKAQLGAVQGARLGSVGGFCLWTAKKLRAFLSKLVICACIMKSVNVFSGGVPSITWKASTHNLNP